MNLVRSISLLVIYSFLTFHCLGQTGRKPLATYVYASTFLSDTLERLVRTEANSFKPKLHKANRQRLDAIEKMVSNRYFIWDDSMEFYVRTIAEKIIYANKLSRDPSFKVLIARNPTPNASCFAKNILILNVGLIGRIQNEDQLAFALAHELSHGELDHIRRRLMLVEEVGLERKINQNLYKTSKLSLDEEDVYSLREAVYSITRSSRAQELSADSLAMVLMSRAGYNVAEAFTCLDAIDEGAKPKYDIGAQFFLPFHFRNYPFQEVWLADRLQVYQQQPMTMLLLSNDSTRTHYAIGIRKKHLVNLSIKFVSNSTEIPSSPLLKAIIDNSEMESVSAALLMKNYDLGLFHALQLLSKYPEHPYLVTVITRILLELADPVNASSLTKFTTNYGDEMRLVNTFLNNLRDDEKEELAFQFVTAHFNSSIAAHYYLLHQAAEMTKRADVASEISKAYKQRFRKNLSVVNME